MLDFNKLYQLPNLTIRTLLLGKWNASMLGPLLNFLPNLHRFETSFSESINESLHFNMYHTSIEHLRISLMDVFNDLEKILPYMPNLKQLRVTGKIPEHSISKNFENLSKILCVHTPDLQKFDCELYCHGCNEQADILIIQQFHSLFNLIQCHLGRFLSQCYTTDLTTHTTLKEFAYSFLIIMNNILSSIPNRLEILPDEIFLEIFEYLKPVDLISFIGHNQRINNIIHDVLTVRLPYLEQFSICSVPYAFGNVLLPHILDSNNFPSLKVLHFSGKRYYMLDVHMHNKTPNSTIRTLILHRWSGSMLVPLLNLLPNLRRLKMIFSESVNESMNFNMYQMSLTHLRISVLNPSNSLEKILPYMPNLKQLSVTGMIREQSILEHFTKLTNILHIHTPDLQKFDCELFCNGMNDHIDIFIIQQLHPLFKPIQRHLGDYPYQCFATNLTEYSHLKEYASATAVPPLTSRKLAGSLHHII
ncbi:unnamed protein product [Rotaria sordida]|uniref:F-box domain-containing protein n=1 Tax=Rotaria sordida TaxID=392033 RepID=A0A818X155_9BILA|nr:unnamed protein product [Rotaria sordida]